MPEQPQQDGGDELVSPQSVRQAAHSDLTYVEEMEEAQRLGICPVCPGGNIRKDPQKWDAYNLKETAYWTVRQTPYSSSGAEFHFIIFLNRHATRTDQLTAEEWIDLHEVINWLTCKPKEIATRLYELRQAGRWDGQVDYQSPSGYVFWMRNGSPSRTGGAMAHLHVQFVVPAENEAVKPIFGQEQPEC